MQYPDLRTQIITAARSLNSFGLCVGTAGNLSTRVDAGFLITPSAVPYHEMENAHIVELDFAGTLRSGSNPSSEWRFHRDIYVQRADVAAIVHAHPAYATAIACTRQDIPAFHYMVAIAGGSEIACAEYATFGTQELSDNIIVALRGRQACLMANHGMIAVGVDLQSALAMAVEVEELARQYWLASQTGKVTLLDAAEMAVNLEKFRSYKQDTEK